MVSNATYSLLQCIDQIFTHQITVTWLIDESLSAHSDAANRNNSMFVCTPGIQDIPIDQLCDGNDDCDRGEDETTTLCESEFA